MSISENSQDDIFLHNTKSMFSDFSEMRKNHSSDEHFKVLVDTASLHSRRLEQSDLVNQIRSIMNERINVKCYSSSEFQGVFNLASSENQFINKVISAFSILQAEVENHLSSAKDRLLSPLIIYGENLDESDKIEMGEAETQIARMMLVFSELMELCVSLFSIAINLVNQLLALYNKNLMNYSESFKNIRLFSALECLSKIFGFIISIDTVVKENDNLVNHWNYFNQMFKKCKADNENFGFSAEQGSRLEKVLKKLEGSIFSQNLLKFSVEYIINETGNLNSDGSKTYLGQNTIFMELLKDFLNFNVAKLSKEVGKLTETTEKIDLLGILGVFSFYMKINKNSFDKSTFKAFWGVMNQFSFIPVLEHVSLNVKDFLTAQLGENKMPSVNPKYPDTVFKASLGSLTESLPRVAKNIAFQVQTWLVKVRSDVIAKAEKGGIERLTVARTKNLVNGLIICFQAKNTLVQFLNEHLASKSEMDADSLPNLVSLIVSIKTIQLEFKQRQIETASSFEDILTFASDSLLEKIKPRVNSAVKGKISYFSSDVKAGFDILSSCLAQTKTPMRMIVAKHALDVVNTKKVFGSDEIRDISFMFWRLEVLANFESTLASVSDLSFLYWYRDLFSEFFSFYNNETKSLVELPLFLTAIEDTSQILTRAKHFTNPMPLISKYQEDLVKQVEKSIFEETARDIENDARLLVHSAIIKGISVDTILNRNKHHSAILSLPKIFFFEKLLDPVRLTEDYLNKLFYEMTALNLHDYKTYEQIRVLCNSMYNLNLHTFFLPSQSLQQGIDLLYIIRNLQAFVGQFNYNIQSQSFIEVTKDENSLSIIGVDQIMSSLNTHGVGIINTVVNKTYQLLRKKIKAIANFIVNQYVKSNLIILERFWNEKKEQLNLQYPYQKAEGLLKEIVGMGVAKDGTNYADKLRVFISQIGNALALIRSIRTALMEFKSHNLSLPQGNLEKVVEHLDCLEGNEELKEVNAVFKETLGLLDKNRENLVNYMSTLIIVFDRFLNDESLEELQQFYLLLPSITINYIENLIISKEKIQQKNIRDAYFSNDGFVLGLAFLLKVFRQEEAFESIHWFESALGRMSEENLKKVSGSDQNMSKRKLQTYKNEFELLHFAYNSSVVLFNDY